MRILQDLACVGTEVVPLPQAMGRILAEDVTARRTQPPADMSAMDGFAVRAADVRAVPVTLKVIGEAAAGRRFEGHVSSGEAVRIFTGAPLPAGADTIIIQEDTDFDAARVTVREAAPKGTYVRRAGLDFRAGEVALAAPRRLTARDIGLLAAMNIPWVTVRRKPVIALLSSGDELVRPGEPIGESQIISTNNLLISAMIDAAGGIALDLGIARDSLEDIREKFREGARADMLVTLGGASVGDHDLIQPALANEGLRVDFWRIAMRPGKPLMFGAVKGQPVLGLPGNPVSAMVCSLLFLLPALGALRGLPPAKIAHRPARLAHDLGENDRREDYMRGRIVGEEDGLPLVQLFGRQDSSMLSTLAAADCLLVRPPLAPALAKGASVNIIPFDAVLPHA